MRSIRIGIVIFCIIFIIHKINCGNEKKGSVRDYLKPFRRFGAGKHTATTRRPTFLSKFGSYWTTSTSRPLSPGIGLPNKCRINLVEYKSGSKMESLQPLYISVTGSWKLPDENSIMEFIHGEELKIDCGNGNAVVGFTRSHVSVKCHGGLYFIEGDNNKHYEFSSFKCTQRVKLVEFYSPPSMCTGTNIGVGFYTSSFGYLKLYEACFESSIKRTIYVKHELQRVGEMQKVLNKMGRKEEADYDFLESSHLGSVGSQYRRPNLFDKGHLSPRGDYVLFTHQRATYSYINTAPQFSYFNQQTWKIFEKKLRKNLPLNVKYTIFTGTFGISPEPCGVLQVPLWFYKVLCNSSRSNCVAFLGMNKKHDSSLSLPCENKCGNKIKDIICCDMSTFVDSVPDLHDLKFTRFLNLNPIF